MSDSAREIVSTRVLNYPPARVFEVFANPVDLARWWGPKGFKNTFKVFDFKPGGQWEFTMHGPDGTDYPNESKFIEITKPGKIVFKHVCPPHFQMTISMEDVGGKTKFGFRMLFDDPKVCEQLKPICVPCNEENFDRLEAVLAGK